MECGCHGDDKVDSLPVTEQESLIVEQWGDWVERDSGGGSQELNTKKVRVDFPWQ